jgi:hypothetical protein
LTKKYEGGSMKKTKYKNSLIASTLFVLTTVLASASTDYVEVSLSAEYEDVSIDIENAIANKGLVVDYKGHIGEMLNRTGADVGSNINVYLHADTWQFCSSILSRKMVEENPSNIAYCPYIVYAYELTAKPDTIYVGYRKHVSDDLIPGSVHESIDLLLESILKEATE